MATRSRIGIQLADDSVLSVYCHWDGYPAFNGVKLQQHFNTREKVAELIDGGDISALHTNVGWDNETLPETGPLYYSSRGENLPPRLDWRISDYLTQDAEEYAYLFTTDGEWLCYDTCKWHDATYLEAQEIPAAVAA